MYHIPSRVDTFNEGNYRTLHFNFNSLARCRRLSSTLEIATIDCCESKLNAVKMIYLGLNPGSLHLKFSIITIQPHDCVAINQ